MAFIQYFTLISMAMMSITRIFVIYSKASASAKRITEVLSTKEGLPIASTSDYPRRAGERGVVFDKVSFEYNGKRGTLCDISFKLPRGKKLGVIGATGSGKTTLTALLMRFYDVGEGSIRIDGRDVRTIPEDELHSMFGVAMQNDFIIADTIRENIRFGRDISDEAIEKAARIAQASEFIAECGGFDYMLEAKGANISGGQKQRLLIARAIAASPDILILDDSSSALDYKTDSLLRRAISDELADTTTIIVAQRVSSVMNCDYILLLDEGRIIGEGTHEMLMQTSSVYREISHSQMGGAILE
jgi:ATP-binding cassette subfamily B protein